MEIRGYRVGNDDMMSMSRKTKISVLQVYGLIIAVAKEPARIPDT